MNDDYNYVLPTAPSFHYTDPFGTGNPPPGFDDFIRKTTAIPEEEKKESPPKLCPFRKRTYFLTKSEHTDSGVLESALDYATFMEEEFLPCLREQCAVWNMNGQVCCY